MAFSRVETAVGEVKLGGAFEPGGGGAGGGGGGGGLAPPPPPHATAAEASAARSVARVVRRIESAIRPSQAPLAPRKLSRPPAAESPLCWFSIAIENGSQ